MPGEIKKIRASVNGGRSKLLYVSEEGFELNGKKYKWDVSFLPDGTFHILLNGKNYQAEVLSAAWDEKSFRIKLDSAVYEVNLMDEFDDLLKKLGMISVHETSIKSVKAPMPGMILKVSVKDGIKVEKGDPLVILKAMKMENIIKSPGRALIQKVLVKEGQAVEKNQDLILF